MRMLGRKLINIPVCTIGLYTDGVDVRLRRIRQIPIENATDDVVQLGYLLILKEV